MKTLTVKLNIYKYIETHYQTLPPYLPGSNYIIITTDAVDTGNAPDWAQQEMGTGLKSWTLEWIQGHMDWDQKQSPPWALAIEEESLILLVTQFYIEYHVPGMKSYVW